MSEMQPGMLALITGAFKLKQNIGKVVELVQLVSEGEVYLAPDGETYQHADKACWVVVGGDIVGWSDHGEFGGFGLCVPVHLMPIKPESDPLDVTHKEELHA